MDKGPDTQSKKDWEDENDEMESIYKFPYPEDLADKTTPSESLSIILTTPITMHKNIAKSRKTYSKSVLRPMIGFGEKEKLVIDTQFKRKSLLQDSKPSNKKSKNAQKGPKNAESVNQGVKPDTQGPFTINSPTVKSTASKSKKSKPVKVSDQVQSNIGYHRTRKNLKRKIEEEKKWSAFISYNTSQLPAKNVAESTLQEETVNTEDNSGEESSNDLNLNFQPPPPAQKLSLMALVQKYSESVDPSQSEEDKRNPRKPVKGKKGCSASKKSLTGKSCVPSSEGQKSNNGIESNVEASESFSFPEPNQTISQEIVESSEVSSPISCREKMLSHMSMRESLIKSCKEKIPTSTLLSSVGEGMNLNSINTEWDNSFDRVNMQMDSVLPRSDCVSSNTVVEERTVVSVKSVVSREKTSGTVFEPDFLVQHRTSYLQSADFFCAFMSEIDPEESESVSETFEGTAVTIGITVRQFCSSPNVNDAFSEILSSCTDVGDPSPPIMCYKFPDDFLDNPFQSMLVDYVDWVIGMMIPRKDELNDSYFSCKYILDFAYKYMSYQECAIMSMVFNDTEEHLKLPSIAAKLSFVGMVIIFNAYLKETCNPR